MKDTARRCTARSKRSGQRCRKAAMLGQKVCRAHGGAAPQALKAASERLRELEHPAVDGLRRALASDDLGAVVRAARDVLDRCGHRSETLSASEVFDVVRKMFGIVFRYVEDPPTRRAILRDARRFVGLEVGPELEPEPAASAAADELVL